MERGEVCDLHYITPITNLQSIMTRGLFSHLGAASVQHVSVANQSVQVNQRTGKRVPNGLLLHDYVNLYFDARNAMMYSLCNQHHDLIVLQVAPDVLDIPGTVISDGNAASGGTAFYQSPAGLSHLDAERVYAEWWTHPDPWEQIERKRQRQAEVLVPTSIPSDFITGCLVREEAITAQCNGIAPQLEVTVSKRMYFR